MVDEILKRKAKWYSRRGLLELDIMLSNFINSPTFENLTSEELAVYTEMLDWQDHDFLNTLENSNTIDNQHIANIIKKIQDSRKSSKT